MEALFLRLVLATLVLLNASDSALQEMYEVKEDSDDVSRHCENTVSEFQCETNSGYTLEVDVNKLNERSKSSLR